MSTHEKTTRTEPLYDPTVPTPSHAESARTLAGRIPDATLATVEEDGHPYASVVLTTLHEGRPVLLISGLATHTHNLKRDPRASLLFREATPDNPLAVGRVSLQGTASPTSDPAAREAFLARHQDARGYADFADFGFWSLEVERVRYIGGFGRMSWVSADGWSQATPDPLDAHAAGIVSHMNEDHRDALQAYVAAFSRAGAVEDVEMTGVDRYGFEMSVGLPEGRRPVRVAFDDPVSTPMEARKALVQLVKRARENPAS